MVWSVGCPALLSLTLRVDVAFRPCAMCRGTPRLDHVSSWMRSTSRAQSGHRRGALADIVRRPHSSYQRVVQGKSPLHFLHFNGAVCSNALFSNTSALTSSLLFRGNSTRKILEHLVCSNTSGFQFWGPLALRWAKSRDPNRESLAIQKRAIRIACVPAI